MRNGSLYALAQRGIDILADEDPVLHDLLNREYHRQTNTLAMIAASSIADPSVLACEGTVLTNVTTEGYPGMRFHAGCGVVDEIENLAIERAKQAFNAQYANVQPHSGSTANEIVLFSFLKPGDTILGLDLDSGGHLTHGAKASITGQYFQVQSYGLNENGFIDYDQAARLAHAAKPKLIICGASAYPRVIDFKRFREIADEVGALLLADISHIAGLVAAGEHPSPINHAHFTTTSTYKQLYGPRGGLILMGKDFDSPAPNSKKALSEIIQRAVFPSFQGTPMLASIAAKARALAVTATPQFKSLARNIVLNANALASFFSERGYTVLTGGTDNHLLMIDLSTKGITGLIAEKALEECNIIVNKNRVPGDTKSALVTSGMRLGSNSLALRGMDQTIMAQCAELIHEVSVATKAYGEQEYHLDEDVKRQVSAQVDHLCKRYPIPRYPLSDVTNGDKAPVRYAVS